MTKNHNPPTLLSTPNVPSLIRLLEEQTLYDCQHLANLKSEEKLLLPRNINCNLHNDGKEYTFMSSKQIYLKKAFNFMHNPPGKNKSFKSTGLTELIVTGGCVQVHIQYQ